MGWFGRSDDAPASSGDHGSTFREESDYNEKSDFATSNDFSSDMGGSVSAPSASSMTDEQKQGLVIQQIQQQMQMEALQMTVQLKLAEIAFDKCLGAKKPSSSLSGSDQSCISTVVGKYLDTANFVAGRSAKQAQRAQEQG